MLCLFILSCHSGKVTPGTSPVYYTDDSYVELLPTQSFKQFIDVPQHIDGHYGEKDFSMDGWARMNDSIINIHLFSAFGTTVGELRYTNDSIVFKSSFIDSEKMKAEYVVADIQLSFYDFETLREHYNRYGFTLTQNFESGRTVRTLSRNGTTIASIEKSGQVTTFKNMLRNYSYIITTGAAQ